LYIDIPEDKATKVFSMMNGSKAEMKSEELIKAELLRLASLNDSDFDKKEEKEKNAIEWDNNMLRSRYAREWDKWLQWWNREDVKKLFKC
jgi:HEPN domain-containing protein